jgi:glutamine amidotransferase
MGWNQLEFSAPSPLLDDVTSGDYVYFVHSYCVPVTESTLATSTYGERFAAIVGLGKVFGAQFHPERSAQTGALVLRNFLLVS